MDDPAERPIPLTSLIFGFGPVLPFPLAAVLAWVLPGPWPMVVTWLAIWWSASILIFLAGVRRGRSFSGDAETPLPPLIAMIWLFVLGAAALVSPTPLLSLVLLAFGYASIAILDPISARRGDAPSHFARLRPPQMGIALIGLIGLILHHGAQALPI